MTRLIRWTGVGVGAIVVVCAFFGSTREAEAIPALARKYGIPCTTCHVHGAKLNTFGISFQAKGAKAMGLEEKIGGVPMTVYASWLARHAEGETDSRFSRLELVAMDELSPRMGFFLEWRALSNDVNGNGFVDRSGRFEDIFLTYALSPMLGLQVGQFRALGQVDVSQRVSNSEPRALAAGMPGPGGSSARLTGLRQFAPSGRSPAIRLATNPARTQGWHTALTVPFAGELSLPLTEDARTHASPELEGTPKGYMLEHWLQRDQDSIGAFAFTGSASRSAFGVVAAKQHDQMHFLGAATRFKDTTGEKNLLSLDALWAPKWREVGGIRLDLEEGAKPAFTPYMSIHIPGPGNVFRIVLEGRFQNGRRPVLSVEINFLH